MAGPWTGWSTWLTRTIAASEWRAVLGTPQTFPRHALQFYMRELGAVSLKAGCVISLTAVQPMSIGCTNTQSGACCGVSQRHS
jgi:hypothetical protein